MIALMHTVLPEPVEPAINTWGIFVKSVTIGLPVTSLPKTIGISAFASAQDLDSIMSRIQTAWAIRLGTSMPTVPFPGTGARIRTDKALNPKAIFLSKLTIFSTRTPAAGVTS